MGLDFQLLRRARGMVPRAQKEWWSANNAIGEGVAGGWAQRRFAVATEWAHQPRC